MKLEGAAKNEFQNSATSGRGMAVIGVRGECQPANDGPSLCLLQG
jgi:hypothetical protein